MEEEASSSNPAKFQQSLAPARERERLRLRMPARRSQAREAFEHAKQNRERETHHEDERET